jgi:membrane associated rhomboid family serine protease
VAKLAAGDLQAIEPLMLQRDGIHPQQWISSNFIHGDVTHLLGNMVFLWVFGLVVEGKLGWYGFLPLYLGIGVIQCAAEQSLAVAFGFQGASYGASAAIYGLMATCLIWAPRNEISFLYWVFVQFGFFDVSILVLSLLYIGVDLLSAWWNGFALSTATLHLTGALVGLIVGVTLLKAKLVDCEGWDIFNVFFGDPTDVDLDDLRKL